MVLLFQLTAGSGFRGRRMVNGVVFWFFISGLIRGSLSSVVDESKASLNNSTKGVFQVATLQKENAGRSPFSGDVNTGSVLHRSSRELPHTKNEDENFLDRVMEAEGISEKITKLPVKSKSLYVIPFFRPGRSNNKNDGKSNGKPNSPTPSFGLTNSDVINSMMDSENGIAVSKRPETVIPTMRFGRSSGKRQNSNSDNVIPYPRLGRSMANHVVTNIGEIQDDDYAESAEEDDDSSGGNEMHDTFLDSGKRQKRDFDEYDTIIPYPRTGRQETSYASIFETKNKRTDSDYVLPQIRYGRSVVLLSSPKNTENPKENPHTFVVPYPRPGRSSKYPEKTGYHKNLQVILPYPRPGRSNLDSKAENLNSKKRQNDFMVPFARLGRVATNFPVQSEELNELIASSLPSKLEQKNYLEKPKDTTELSSIFMIPYPRPGKKSTLTLTGLQEKPRQSNVRKEVSDYVLPYPRPGKKSSIPLKNLKNSNTENENAQKFILPYPRPGRSSENIFDENLEVLEQLNENTGEDSVFMDIDKDRKIDDTDSKTTDLNEYLWKNDKKLLKDTFVLPHARLSENVETAIPYFTLNQYKLENMDSDYSLPDHESITTDERFTDLHNDGDSHLRYKRSNSVVPYPRLGRSEVVIPYPRLGRYDSVVPYPRPGRSNFVVPYPRVGKSNSVVPYPRTGRSNYEISHPRIKKPNSVVPYPRLGRSDSVVPYPRLGRSDSVIPYPRLGRSDSIVPYPRPGRYVVPYLRLDRSNSVLPYPRPGRSNSVVPYPRPGRSNSVVPYPRPGRSNSVVPYPRPGRSKSIQLSPRLRSSLSVAPHLRLRRSRQDVPISAPKYKDNTGNWILPNIRPGRSDAYEYETDIIPYPRPGRFQNNLMLTEDSGYSSFANRLRDNIMIPYPRPGRTTNSGEGYVLPQPRMGRSNSSVKDTEELSSSNTIIPYPRVGRSQEEVTPSPDLSSSSHKLNKHMLTRVDDSIYLLPYPRPGRYSE